MRNLARGAGLIVPLLAGCGGGGGDGTTAPREIVANITLTAPKTSLAVREQSTVAAVFRDANGRTLIGVTGVVWSSADPSTVTVDQSGNIEALKLGGPVTISASKDGVTGAIAFSGVPVVRIQPAVPTLGVDSSVALSAIYTDHFGVVIGTPTTVTWSTTNTNTARVDAGGRVTGIAPGQAGIAATVPGASYTHPIEVGVVSPFDGEWAGAPYQGGFSTTRATFQVVFGEVRVFSMPIVFVPPSAPVTCNIAFSVGGRTPVANGTFALSGAFGSTVTATVTGANAIDVSISTFVVPNASIICTNSSGVFIDGGILPDTRFDATTFVATK